MELLILLEIYFPFLFIIYVSQGPLACSHFINTMHLLKRWKNIQAPINVNLWMRNYVDINILVLLINNFCLRLFFFEMRKKLLMKEASKKE